jgi:hypothetical protein
MSESHYVGAYWGNRKETAEQCAQRLESLLKGLSLAGEAFSQWYEKGHSAKEALRREVRTDKDSLKGLLERGRSRRDSNGGVMEDLGFSLSIWNGSTDAESDLIVHCASWASTPAVWIPNSCVLNLPSDGPDSDRFRNVDTLVTLVDSIVRAFEPERAVVTSEDDRDIVSNANPGARMVGWLTYVDASRDRLPRLPPGVRVVSMGDSGSLIIATESLSAVDSSKLESDLTQIESALTGAGLLGRIA